MRTYGMFTLGAVLKVNMGTLRSFARLFIGCNCALETGVRIRLAVSKRIAVGSKRDEPNWDPLFDPSIPPKVYVGPFLAFFPRKYGTQILFMRSKMEVLEWGPKEFMLIKFMCFVCPLNEHLEMVTEAASSKKTQRLSTSAGFATRRAAPRLGLQHEGPTLIVRQHVEDLFCTLRTYQKESNLRPVFLRGTCIWHLWKFALVFYLPSFSWFPPQLLQRQLSKGQAGFSQSTSQRTALRVFEVADLGCSGDVLDCTAPELTPGLVWGQGWWCYFKCTLPSVALEFRIVAPTPDHDSSFCSIIPLSPQALPTVKNQQIMSCNFGPDNYRDKFQAS